MCNCVGVGFFLLGKLVVQLLVAVDLNVAIVDRVKVYPGCIVFSINEGSWCVSLLLAVGCDRDRSTGQPAGSTTREVSHLERGLLRQHHICGAIVALELRDLSGESLLPGKWLS